MKAKSISSGHSGHQHGLLWYCFECLFHHKKFIEERDGFGRSWKLRASKRTHSIDFFDDVEDFNEYMRSVEGDR